MLSPSLLSSPLDAQTVAEIALRRQLTLLKVCACDLTVVNLPTEFASWLMRLGGDPNDAHPQQAIA
jgi:hypothetical protein